jgi:hypothetical protein
MCIQSSFLRRFRRLANGKDVARAPGKVNAQARNQYST